MMMNTDEQTSNIGDNTLAQLNSFFSNFESTLVFFLNKYLSSFSAPNCGALCSNDLRDLVKRVELNWKSSGLEKYFASISINHLRLLKDCLNRWHHKGSCLYEKCKFDWRLLDPSDWCLVYDWLLICCCMIFLNSGVCLGALGGWGASGDQAPSGTA